MSQDGSIGFTSFALFIIFVGKFGCHRYFEATSLDAGGQRLLPLPFRVFADAASPRRCGDESSAMQRISLNRTFDGVNSGKFQTDLSLRAALTIESRTNCEFILLIWMRSGGPSNVALTKWLATSRDCSEGPLS